MFHDTWGRGGLCHMKADTNKQVTSHVINNYNKKNYINSNPSRNK